MEKASLVDRVVSIVASIAIVIAVAILLEQRLKKPASAANANRVELIKDWSKRVRNTAAPLGDTSGQVKVVVFTDFECPFCARLDSTLRAVEAKHPNSIARFVVHFPLSGHRFARLAATAFECSSMQDRSRQMHTILYKSQSRFGLDDWTSFATLAGVPDTTAFRRCIAAENGKERIDAGLALAETLSLNRTPVAVVNGWMLDPVTPVAIERAIDAALMGKSPKP